MDRISYSRTACSLVSGGRIPEGAHIVRIFSGMRTGAARVMNPLVPDATIGGSTDLPGSALWSTYRGWNCVAASIASARSSNERSQWKRPLIPTVHAKSTGAQSMSFGRLLAHLLSQVSSYATSLIARHPSRSGRQPEPSVEVRGDVALSRGRRREVFSVMSPLRSSRERAASYVVKIFLSRRSCI